jgi:nucleoside-triphosphatase
VLVTGPPGCGKTTVVLATIGLLRAAGVEVHGFVTRERRDEGGHRYAFDVVDLDGQTAQIANVNWSTGVQVGRYGVDVPSFEQVALPALRRAMNGNSPVVLDELGSAQLSCGAFVRLLDEILAGPWSILATIHTHAHAITDQIRTRPDIDLIPVTNEGREALPYTLSQQFIHGAAVHDIP